MFPLVLQAFAILVLFDGYLARGNFAAFYEAVRKWPRARKSPPPELVHRVCCAVDLASIWYWKRVLCLQRSAATTCLLKTHGVPAQMILGAQSMPFQAHAWVEVDGKVVNDKLYVQEIYAVIDRC